MSLKKRTVNSNSGKNEEAAIATDSQLTKKSKSDNPSVFELGGRKKVTIGEYLGKRLINIREYYEDKATGEEKPGNKGIALNVDQWNNFVKQINDIDAAVKGP